MNLKLAIVCVMLVGLSLVPLPSSAQTPAIMQIQCARGKMTSGTSFTDVLSNAPTAGNDLILSIAAYGSGTVPTISSITEANVAWSMQKASSATTGSNDAEIWLGVVSSGASSTITISLTLAPSFGAVSDVCEYSGLGSSPLDQTATNSGVSSPGNTGTTGVTSQSSELWIGAIAAVNTISGPTNGFALIDGVANNPPNVANGYFWKVVSSTGQASAGTSNSIGNVWTGVIATFKASTGSTTTTSSTSSSSSTTTTSSTSSTSTGPSQNAFNVRAGAVQVVVTVVWTGTGTASVQIAGPGGTPTLSESGAVVYDRITYNSGSSSPTNIHRVTFTLNPSPTTTQTWTALVSLSSSYTITIEVS